MCTQIEERKALLFETYRIVQNFWRNHGGTFVAFYFREIVIVYCDFIILML